MGMILKKMLFLIVLIVNLLSTTGSSANITINEFSGIELASAEQIKCLATAIYFEGRDQPINGQIAIGLVIGNRVKSDKYPNTICDVVTQGKRTITGKIIKHKCQFSFFCDGKSDKPKNEEAWEASVLIAEYTLFATTYDFTDGAMFYHADYVTPNWSASKIRTLKIADHIFYR